MESDIRESVETSYTNLQIRKIVLSFYGLAIAE